MMAVKFQPIAWRNRLVIVRGWSICGFFGICLPWSGSALAMDYKADLRLGYLTRQVEFRGDLLNDTAGETHNDEQVINSQIKLKIDNFDSSKDRVNFDFRGKRDVFGKLDRENLRLINYDRKQLRVLAYQRPWESNQTYFTVGRFVLTEAKILANDGIELGYRSSKATRYGLFAGQAPKNIITPLYVDPETRQLSGVQAGAYINYEVKDGFEDSSFLSNSIAQAPSYDITDAQNHAYYYQQGMWTVATVHRFGSLVHFDFAPKSNLRRGFLSYAYQSERLRAATYFQQTNAEDYLIKQTLQDTLVPSPVQTLNLELRYRMWSSFAVDLSRTQGRRTADGLASNENAVGLLFPRILGGSSSTRLQVGARQNFQSQDKFTKVAYDYFAKTFSFGLSVLLVDESYEDGTKNKRNIVNLDSGIFLFEDFRSSLGYEIENDSKVRASAFFMMFGYRLGSGTASSPRVKPAHFEEI